MSIEQLPPGQWHPVPKERMQGLSAYQPSRVNRFFLWVTRRNAGAARDLNVFTMLARLERIFPRYLLFLSHILMRGRITRVDKERVILRAAWRLGSIYEWGHHVSMASDLGIGAEEIASLAQEESSLWDSRLRVLVAATDELVLDKRLSDATWVALSSILDDNQRVEFCMMVGHYIMVAITLNSLGVELEEGYLAAQPVQSG